MWIRVSKCQIYKRERRDEQSSHIVVGLKIEGTITFMLVFLSYLIYKMLKNIYFFYKILKFSLVQINFYVDRK
jgi:hypothetical protein